jgi:hydroxymethylbilane synthase
LGNVLKKILIGTRGSKLALWQANWVKNRLTELRPDIEFELKIIKTVGDVRHDLSPEAFGNEGIFTAELDRGLLDKDFDLAVHSLKDLPTTLAPGLFLAAVTDRASVADMFILNKEVAKKAGITGTELSEKDILNCTVKITVGTSSLRRMVLLKNKFLELKFAPMRGNLDTRVRKLDEKQVDALVVAKAGLDRLEIDTGDHPAMQLLPDWYLPAAGQGALGIESRDSGEAMEIASALEHSITRNEVDAERTAMNALGAGCRVPAGFLAKTNGNNIRLLGVVGSPERTDLIRVEVEGPADDPDKTGKLLADKLLAAGAKEVLKEVRE